jgi:hypothetical protein
LPKFPLSGALLGTANLADQGQSSSPPCCRSVSTLSHSRRANGRSLCYTWGTRAVRLEGGERAVRRRHLVSAVFASVLAPRSFPFLTSYPTFRGSPRIDQGRSRSKAMRTARGLSSFPALVAPFMASKARDGRDPDPLIGRWDSRPFRPIDSQLHRCAARVVGYC